MAQIYELYLFTYRTCPKSRNTYEWAQESEQKTPNRILLIAAYLITE